ncbi:unnamed protein product, partial [Adineta steineri]
KIQEHGVVEINRRKEKREVTIAVHIATNKIDVVLDISYLISNCSWTASYDVRVNSAEATKQQTQLTYYGSIINKSQENWTDVQLSLSTATPSLGGAVPKLGTLKIGYLVPRYNSYRSPKFEMMDDLYEEAETHCLKAASFQSKSFAFSKRRAKTSLNSIETDELEAPGTINVFASQTEASMSSSSFTIPRRATIDADVCLLFIQDLFYF